MPKKITTVPTENDPLYRFYVSLFKQNPNSEMAINWLIKNGFEQIILDFKKLKL